MERNTTPDPGYTEKAVARLVDINRELFGEDVTIINTLESAAPPTEPDAQTQTESAS